MFKIIWTPESKLAYSEALQFIAVNSTTYANKVIDEVIKTEKRLAHSPFLGVKVFEYPEKNIRKITILGHYSLLYRVFDDFSIYIIYFWDNRQNPQKLKERIK